MWKTPAFIWVRKPVENSVTVYNLSQLMTTCYKNRQKGFTRNYAVSNKRGEVMRYQLTVVNCDPPFIGRNYDRDVGSVRTVPENYYVATIWKNKVSGYRELEFEGIEAMTRDINQVEVCQWFDRYQG